ncbi:hypothetical protein METSMIF1_02247 [Methanobrevibacter smithii DSM 2374]|uniref:Uncharacterized protein n=1 Tax=Methanobrevibacter smithii DSM 2374 TaxID=521002 RepID=D2ZN43_METSM|nr:hypothetical protein METSMIF1_02247 [Methanobrevibacter smithii DSM 2374]
MFINIVIYLFFSLYLNVYSNLSMAICLIFFFKKRFYFVDFFRIIKLNINFV